MSLEFSSKQEAIDFVVEQMKKDAYAFDKIQEKVELLNTLQEYDVAMYISDLMEVNLVNVADFVYSYDDDPNPDSPDRLDGSYFNKLTTQINKFITGEL